MNELSNRMALSMVGLVVLTVALTVLFNSLFTRTARAELSSSDYGARLETLLSNPVLRNAETSDLPALRAFVLKTDAFTSEALAVGSDYTQFMTVQRRSFWSAVLAALLLCGFAGWFLGRRLAAPSQRVAQAAERVAGGDLSARVLEPREFRNQQSAAMLTNFNTMVETLERLEEERKATLNDVAHDLRTPLTVIQGKLDAFSYGVTPLTPETVGGLQRPVELLTRLISDLRTLALAEGGQLALEPEATDLSAIARQALVDYGDRAAARGVTLTLQTSGSLHLEADPDRLYQIIYNLLDNALKYTPEGGEVTLCLLEEGGEAQLIVRDSGSGFSEENIRQVMNRFYRVDAAKGATEMGSSGLGLAIVNALAQLHGGQVEVANAEEGGAQFKVSLPRVSTLASAAAS